MLAGPNTGIGHNSLIFMIEAQLNYVLDALRTMESRGIASVDVRPDVQANFNADIDRRFAGTVWPSGCASWYVDATGRVLALWPGVTWRFRQATRSFDRESYFLRPRARSQQPGPAVATAVA